MPLTARSPRSQVDEDARCACGCNQLLPPSRGHIYYPTRFLRGHNMRVTTTPNRVYTPSPEEIPSGLCECNCGRATEIAPYTDHKRRWFRGHPKPLISHHSALGLGRRPQLAPLTLSDTEAAYLAGIVDGEGNISFRGTASVRLHVGNTSEPLIAWLESRVGGRSYCAAPIPNRLTVWRWAIGNRVDVLAVLQRIEPFMIVKRDQAQRAIAALQELPLDKRPPKRAAGGRRTVGQDSERA